MRVRVRVRDINQFNDEYFNISIETTTFKDKNIAYW